MPIAFIIGTAGSGKSLLTAAFSEWLKISKQDVAVVNLDPGALTLPYSPYLDVRNYVDVRGLMEEYGLGPNGALIMAADLIADKIEEISKEIEDSKSDIVLVDTSGQMELFAFRASGPYIASELTKEPKAIVYLFDAVFQSTPLTTFQIFSFQQQFITVFFYPKCICFQNAICFQKRKLTKLWIGRLTQRLWKLQLSKNLKEQSVC